MLAAGTGSGAEATSPTVEFRGDDGKKLAAILARCYDSPSSLAVGAHDEQFFGLDLLRSRAVAAATRRRQVIKGIIQRIAIDMVRNKRISGIAALAHRPVDLGSAPVAGVRARSQFLEQQGAGLTDQTRFSGQRVIWRIPNTPVNRGVLSSGCVSAGFRAELPDKARRPVVFRTAMPTGVSHR